MTRGIRCACVDVMREWQARRDARSFRRLTAPMRQRAAVIRHLGNQIKMEAPNELDARATLTII